MTELEDEKARLFISSIINNSRKQSDLLSTYAKTIDSELISIEEFQKEIQSFQISDEHKKILAEKLKNQEEQLLIQRSIIIQLHESKLIILHDAEEIAGSFIPE